MADFTKEEIENEKNVLAIASLKEKAIKTIVDKAYADKSILSNQIAVIDQTAQADIEKIKVK